MQVFAFFYVCWRSSLGYHIPDYLWLSRGLRNFRAMDDGGSTDWENVVRRWGRECLSDSVQCNFCCLAIVQQYFNNINAFWGTFLCAPNAQGLNKELPNHLLLCLNQCGEAVSHPFCSHWLWLCLQEPRGQRHPLHPSRCFCQDEEPAAAVSVCPAPTLRKGGFSWPGPEQQHHVIHITTRLFPPPLHPPLWRIFTHEELSHVIVSEIRSWG